MTSAVKSKIKADPSISIKGYIISIALSTVLAILLLLASSAVTYKTSDPDSFCRYTALAALFLSVFTGGIIASRITGSGAISGLITAVWFIIITCAVSLFFKNSAFGFWISLALRLSLLPVGFAGGFLGTKKDKKKYSKKRKKMYRR